MTIFGFDGFTPYELNYDAIDKNNAPGAMSDMFTYFYSHCADIIVRISDDIPTVKVHDYYNYTGLGIKFESLIEVNKTDFDEKSLVYVHPSCTIPRANVRQKYKRVIKPAKADICVIPKLPTKAFGLENIGIFVNEAEHLIFYVKDAKKYIRASNSYMISQVDSILSGNLGKSLKEINPKLYNINGNNVPHFLKRTPHEKIIYDAAMDSKLVYLGKAITISKDSEFLGDCLDGNIHNLVTEDKIAITLGSESNNIDKDILDNIKSFIDSGDPAVVGLGLKTLSELDYLKYKNSVKYLLAETRYKWEYAPTKDTTGVKYMLKSLQLDSSKYFDDITPEDFELLKHVVEEELERKINNIKQSISDKFPFAYIKMDVNSSVTRLP